jgi:glutathione S-transferase
MVRCVSGLTRSAVRVHNSGEKERLYEQAVRSGDYLDGRFLADAWCAAFVWKKNSLIDYPITEDIFRQIEQNPTAFHNDKRAMTVEIQRLAQQYQFVHWHLNFRLVRRIRG